MWKILFAILSVVTVFISPDCGGSAVKILDAWAVEEAPLRNPDMPDAPVTGSNANVYFTIDNQSKEVDQLVGVNTQIADSAQIVEMVMKDGTLQPQPSNGIEIKAGKQAALRPHKTFIQLKNLKQPLIEGASFQLTLSFQTAGEIKQSILVEKPGSTKYHD